MASKTHRLAQRQSRAQPEPEPGCPRCPRLVSFREAAQRENPAWFNGAVPSFGDERAELLIVGLAPGLQGANRTGRPFTGDYAGDLLYQTLISFGFARGQYDRRADDGLELHNCMITNAVRCVPPQNKPTPLEIRTCRPFLAARFAALEPLKVIVALGRVAHDTTLATLDAKKSAYPFAHGAVHALSDIAGSKEAGRQLTLIDSYHCSRYNTNTGRLTEGMFRNVFEIAASRL